MSKVKKTDHSANVLASIRSQVPTAVDKYLGTKLDNALLKVLERHTADLIEKYSVLPGPESIQNQESEKSPKEIIRIQKGTRRGETRFNLLHQGKLIKDLQWIKPVGQQREKIDSADFWVSSTSSERCITKVQRKPGSLMHLYQTTSRPKPSTGWPIMNPRDAGADSSMHISDPESEHSKQSSDDITMQDEGNDSDMEDNQQRSHYQGVARDFPTNQRINWANNLTPQRNKVPEENKLQRKTYDIGSFIKWFCRRTGKKKLCKADLEGVQKSEKIALSIIQAPKAAFGYLDFGLEELVPSLWVESEREYDISAVYGITHWWFRRKEFYINKHSEFSDREAVRSQMRILSVISCQWKQVYLSVLRIIIVILPENIRSERLAFHNEDGKSCRAKIKQALGMIILKIEMENGDTQFSNVKEKHQMLRTRPTLVIYDVMERPIKVVKASANTVVMFHSQVQQ
ncbi:hypothetical protein Tco_0580509 [Tanacetum coccineum]